METARGSIAPLVHHPTTPQVVLTDLRISQLHAKLVPCGPDSPSAFAVHDMSTNGVFVNGVR
jgi:FHA domain.